MIKNGIHVFLIAVILVMLSFNFASALTVENIESDIIHPGKTGKVSILVDNELGFDLEDVSVSIDLSGTPLSTLGSSQDSVDEIQDDESETFLFTLAASPSAQPGDYNIPYTIKTSDDSISRKGTFGVKVRANSDIDFSSSIDNPIVGEKAQLSIKMINKGLGEARFVTIRVQPQGYTLLSENYLYIGSIDSDDFETATFDIIIKNQNVDAIATIEYEDIDGNKYSQDLDTSIKTYTQERAIELGIRKKNNLPFFMGIVIALIIIWIFIRAIRKMIKKRKSLQSNQRE